MADYIDRKLAKRLFANDHDYGLAKRLDEVPTADVVEVRHGRWVITKEYNDIIEMDVAKYTCSACGEYRLSSTTLSQATKYCPNCGARMDGGDTDA